LLFFFNKILEVPVGKKSDKIFIPKIILSSDKLTKAFIQGLADADFSLCLKRRYKKVAYYPTIAGFLNSKRMMKQISVYLRRKCIPHSLLLNVKSFDKRFNKFWTSHRIYIYGKKNVYKWMLTIGFRNPKFLKIAREALLETS
jgi:hypothetical protein